jgi:predicted nucleic acid-binding protein
MAGPTQPEGLIDTVVLIDAMRNRPDAVAFLAAASAGGRPPISVITAMELIRGARNAKDLADIRSFLGYFTVHQLAPTTSAAALALMEQFSLSHSLEIPDALIAATVLELGLSLYTLNAKHFHMIPGLNVLRPY